MLSRFKQEFDKRGEVYLRVKVRPGAGETRVKGVMVDGNGETVKIDVAAPPVKGKANQELIKFLAKEFEINKNGVKIIGGAGEKMKLIKILK